MGPAQAIGKLFTLWTAFARFYERHGDIDNARVIFDKATQVSSLSFRAGRSRLNPQALNTWTPPHMPSS